MNEQYLFFIIFWKKFSSFRITVVVPESLFKADVFNSEIPRNFILSFKQILLKESRKVNLKLNYLSQFWFKLENEYILNSEVLLKIQGFISIFYIGQSTFIACNPYVWIPKLKRSNFFGEFPD